MFRADSGELLSGELPSVNHELPINITLLMKRRGQSVIGDGLAYFPQKALEHDRLQAY